MSRRTRLTLIALTAGIVGATAASAAQTITYTYDARGRVVQVDRDDTLDNNKDARACYKLDKADNRTRVKVNTGSSLPLCPP
jgi:YD repeat-containing protein